MDIKVVEKDSLKVVGISWNGTYSQMSTIPRMFTELEERLEEIPYKAEEPVLIAPFHSRETEFTYYVTAPVEKIERVPAGMVGFTIPPKNYVFTTYLGKPEEVENTYLQLFKWMQEYGYDHDQNALSLEIYKDKPHNTNGELHLEIYLPVKVYK
ncbi:GyrI-like domain-containing protein [Bacillus sp. FJAT-29814]|uniref:GyrI-like domain-containing protein n=1 Tax=Bacillus sp. FJAT-29814 TaxID=1729688 RepID=UPI00083612CC|nr:GyrI-like domain-containing protein [Bacillus sp. FJAT-29814]